MTPMQSRTNKLTLILLCCLALAGFAGLDLCRDSGGGDRRPTMQIQPPTAPEARGAIPDQTLVEGGTETLDVEPYFTDPDGDSLTYEVESNAPLVVGGQHFRQRGDDERAPGRYDGSGACDGDGSRRIVRVLGFHRSRSGTDTIAAFP